MAYTKPQALVFQEFTQAPAELTDPLRAVIVGPNVELHRYSEEDEKALINVGAYDRLSDNNYAWPDREAGSIVDPDSVKLYIEDALLMYFEDLIGDTSGGRGVTTAVSGRKNWIRSTAVNFRANGTSWPRSSLLNDRDVAVGDVVYLRGVDDVDGSCEQTEFYTTVTGFAADEEAAIVGDVINDSNNQDNVGASTTVEQTAGEANCITLTADGTEYDGLASGYINECYTITVIASSVAGCNAARLRITSDSGTDNVDELEPEDFGTATDIGTRGLKVTFNQDGTCVSSSSQSSSASSDSLFPKGPLVDKNEDTSGQLQVGQVWKVCVTQGFEKVCGVANNTYTGPDDDTYIVEVTKGGTWADLPEVTVTTVKGLDSSGPTTVTGDNTAVPVGTYGVTISFSDCANLESSSSSSISSMGDNNINGLRKGDKFFITVLTGADGPVRTLILRDDLPTAMLSSSDLDVRLFIQSTIEVTENRLNAPPLVNYEIESTQLVVKSGITAYDATWTDNGVEQPLEVWSGSTSGTAFGAPFGIMYIQYNEWLASATTSLGFIDDVDDIDLIPGQLDEANELKWGAYRALQNSNGTKVGYLAVADPTDLDSWQDAVAILNGRRDIYNYVPLTYDREVQNLFQTQVNSESTAEKGNWKGMIVGLQYESSKMVIGQSDADTQALTPTSIDGNVVLATLEDNPQATGTQYTLLSVPAGNAGFITHGVQAGDIVRFLFTPDAFGNPTYTEFQVDSVLSEESLLLLSGHTAPITVAQKVEIWHTLSKDEIVTDLVDQAQSFADRRVVATIPDLAGTGGNTQAGYFVSAAIGGLASGVVPHQGLTNVAVAGFDDLSSRTTDFFTDSQLDALAEGGVWIVTEDEDGTPVTRHAVTTDTTDLNRQEEMIRRNVDSMSFLFLARLRPLIGRANASPSILGKLRYEINKTIKFFKTNNYSEDLGPQLIDGSFATDADGNIILRIHPLAADRVEAVVDLVVPAPLNNIELHLVV